MVDGDGAAVELPLACTLGPDDGAARLRRWRALAARFPPHAVRAPGRLELRWRLDPEAARELHALAGAERECCAFASWTVIRDGADTILRVTADPERPDDLAAVEHLFDAVLRP